MAFCLLLKIFQSPAVNNPLVVAVAVGMVLVITLVTSPLLLTVMDGIVILFPYVPTVLFTVASVKGNTGAVLLLFETPVASPVTVTMMG